MSVEEFNEMGPIDYILVEWPGRQPNGEGAVIDQLKELGELKSQGILTEEEFAAQKAKLLG